MKNNMKSLRMLCAAVLLLLCSSAASAQQYTQQYGGQSMNWSGFTITASDFRNANVAQKECYPV
jgi:ABC-type oligopeptide transport system substrate-binding subunit